MIIAPRRVTRDLLTEESLTWPLVVFLAMYLFGGIYILIILAALLILMAGSARFLSLLFGGKVTFRQYLVLFGYSLFSFFLIASILDAIYVGLMLGNFFRQQLFLFPYHFWAMALVLVVIYNGIICQEGEGWAWWKSVLVAVITFIWPMTLMLITIWQLMPKS